MLYPHSSSTASPEPSHTEVAVWSRRTRGWFAARGYQSMFVVRTTSPEALGGSPGGVCGELLCV